MKQSTVRHFSDRAVPVDFASLPMAFPLRSLFRYAVTGAFAALLAACSSTQAPSPSLPPETGPTPPPPAGASIPPLASLPQLRPRPLAGAYRMQPWSALPGWPQADMQGFWHAFQRDCLRMMRSGAGASLSAPSVAPPRAWQPVCAAAFDADTAPAADDDAQIRQFIETHLRPWQLNDAGGAQATNLITGYYEPLVEGSRERGGAYQWPLYGVPADLVTVDLGSVYPALAGQQVRGKLVGHRVVPYDSRADIAAAPDKPPVLMWINDPIAAFFFEVQGSGRVRLADGDDGGAVVRLAYADRNGRPYFSIGRWLIDHHQLTAAQASMQGIQAWARQHPDQVQALLNQDPAVVFFREVPDDGTNLGPAGAFGIALTPQRSIAVDTKYVPLGTPVYLAIDRQASSAPAQRLVLAQDTGTAIQGAARADYFWGFGPQAGEQAGHMKQRGRMWLLWPAAAGEPSAR